MRSQGRQTASPLRVYWSVTPEQGSSTYIRTVVSGLRDRGVTVNALSVFELLRQRGQIIHIQWPEHISRGTNPFTTALKHGRALGLLVAWKLRGHRLVVTAHNRTPHHETNAFDSKFRAAVYRNADAVIALVAGHFELLEQDGTIDGRIRREAIPHPLVTERVATNRDRSDGALVILGQIHPYHLIEEFIAAWEDSSVQRQVIVIGAPGDPELAERLRRKASTNEALRVYAEFMPDDELADVLADAVAIVALQRNTFCLLYTSPSPRDS